MIFIALIIFVGFSTRRFGFVSYAARFSAYNTARFSAYNNIEHLWSPMSKLLSTVILLSRLEGNEEEPSKQNPLTTNYARKKLRYSFTKTLGLLLGQLHP